MLSNDSLIRKAAGFKTDSDRRFDDALSRLIALAWEYRYLGGDFRFDADPELYAKALEICRWLTDGCIGDAQKIIQSLFEDAVEWDEAMMEDVQRRFDMSGSHLLLLLNAWIAAAFLKDYTQTYTRISILRFINNPVASGMFGAWGKDVLSWGRGYSKSIPDQLALIGQNFIIEGSRLQEWRDEVARGATYYVRRRGSSYDCPDCESVAGIPIPIDQPFEQLHARCVCWPEYHYEPIPTP